MKKENSWFLCINTVYDTIGVQERKLLSVAYKNVINSLRAPWRIVSSIKQKNKSRKNDDHMALVRDYRSKGAIPHRDGFIAGSTLSPLYLPRITKLDGETSSANLLPRWRLHH
ncbi:hypothetical protein RJ639_037139 [Escallonia herrerae]|uniref:14-3-3 domain-containing protein n=1 Tax=Escallonia herrerae TaxID=1293975 RepID=A0AA88WYY5_9ASTE|nr:hypothetical protein RJ639_037139 [Escallonia herrerae]